MPAENTPEWLDFIFVGFEDPPEGDPDDEEEEEEEEEEEGGDDKDKDKDKGPDVEGLKSALRKERRAAKDATRELNKLKKEKQQGQETEEKDLEAARKAQADAESKSEKLAVKLRAQAIESAVSRAATKMKFIDPDDALALIDMNDLDVEQDEDDPAEVDVDVDSVEEALKALAKKKPHLLKVEGAGEEGSESSGGKFGGGKSRKDAKADEDFLREQYPALRR